MRRLLAAPLLVLLASPALAADEPGIALVKTVDGAAFAVRDGERVALAPGAALYARDVLETGGSGALGVTFKDGTRISLGPNAQLECKDFAFAPGEERMSFLVRLLRGTMMFVSGSLSKLAPEAVKVETPVATIAVRGTTFLAKIDPD
jgi:hypothetical protein